MVLAWWSSCSF